MIKVNQILNNNNAINNKRYNTAITPTENVPLGGSFLSQ
jgi:hypothetical protein